MIKILKISLPLIFFLFLMYAFSYNTSIAKPLNLNGEELEFVVDAGASVDRIASNLEKMKLIGSARHFKTHIWLEDLGSSLQAGTFLISSKMSAREIAKALAAGETVSREKNVKIIEGWRISEIDEYLEKNNVLVVNDYRAKATQKNSEWNFSFAKPNFLASTSAEADLEGYLFPDTYKIFVDASAEDLIEKQLDNFGVKLNSELRAEITKQEKSIEDVVIMASIIEKEVSLDQDRAIVAGILYKRMDIGMRLEVDSTINYITGKNDPGALLVDLDIDSPYNTYRNDGLPLGPICNPGLSALKAAIYPEDSDYLFYLNRQDTMETIFSKNYSEHLQNKAKYLK